jgi:hypothetical protein
LTTRFGIRLYKIGEKCGVAIKLHHAIADGQGKKAKSESRSIFSPLN